MAPCPTRPQTYCTKKTSNCTLQLLIFFNKKYGITQSLFGIKNAAKITPAISAALSHSIFYLFSNQLTQCL